MSYRIAVLVAAAVIGISCIATDASARGGGGGGHGGRGPMAAVNGKSYNSVNTNAVIKSYNAVNTKPKGKFRMAEGWVAPPATLTQVDRGLSPAYLGPSESEAPLAAAHQWERRTMHPHPITPILRVDAIPIHPAKKYPPVELTGTPPR